MSFQDIVEPETSDLKPWLRWDDKPSFGVSRREPSAQLAECSCTLLAQELASAGGASPALPSLLPLGNHAENGKVPEPVPEPSRTRSALSIAKVLNDVVRLRSSLPNFILPIGSGTALEGSCALGTWTRRLTRLDDKKCRLESLLLTSPKDLLHEACGPMADAGAEQGRTSLLTGSHRFAQLAHNVQTTTSGLDPAVR